ncbi:phage tail protein [Yersinia mollaretii]|uniref:phage tail protein n=1 Tax=Yersinia mollaretii TaxID=33060 RepID=UPI001FD45E84|nr:phage tail protein [Yersinia mollaretii]
MTARFFALLTNIGAAKLANATALGTRLEITQMAVGDGGGTLPTPIPAQTKLVNEQRRAALNMLTIDPINTSQIIAEQVIPETEGGWWIREIGLLDKDGDLIAIANCAETYKPQLQEGSGRTQTIRMILIVSSTAAVTLKIDPSVVLATRKYADDKAIEVKQYADNLLTEHEKSRNHPDASKTEKGFVKLSSATTSDSEVLAATPKAVKTVAEAAAKALGDHGKDANPHDQYFQIANLLSEIKALGPAALAETLANLGLGEAAKRGVGTETNDIPDIAISDKRYIKVNAENTRLWVSNEYTPVNNTMTISAHGLTGLNLLRCKCDVVLKRAVAGDGYAVGDVALSASLTINAVAYHTLSVTPSLSLTDIRLFTPVTDTSISGIEFINRTTGALVTNSPVSNWRYIFRIWY